MRESRNRRIGFLLGAGVSLDCRAPSTAAITDEVLNAATRLHRHTDDRYYFRSTGGPTPAPPSGVPPITAVQRVIDLLAECVNRCYDQSEDPQGCIGRRTSYEDIAFLAAQAEDAATGERDNPALEAFLHELTIKLAFSDRRVLKEHVGEARKVIHDIVRLRLAGLQPTENHLQCVRDVAAQQPSLPILTLNHDCLIEKAFKLHKLPLDDLLVDVAPGRRRLEPRRRRRGMPSLFKLHGSTSWYRWRLEREPRPFWREWIGSIDDPDSQRVWWSRERPLMLVGRFNKELDYVRSPYLDVLIAGRDALRTVDDLVVSGYSFGDKAVNATVVEWIYSKSPGTRRLIVAHENPTSLWDGARGAVRNKLQEWLAARALVQIESFLGSLSGTELRRELERERGAS